MFNTTGRWRIFFSLLLVTAGSVCAEATDFSRRPSIDEKIERILKGFKGDRLSGTLEVKGPNFRLVKHFNNADDSRPVPNGPDVSYVIASTSKQWIAAGILRLEERGRLSLQDPLSRYFPEFPLENLTGTDGEVVRLIHLLNHTSGLFEAYDEKTLDDRVLREPLGFADILAEVLPRALRSNPGAHFHYSDSSYDILAEVIRRVSGLSYGQFMKVNFFGPLDLEQTTVGFSVGGMKNLARSYDSAETPRKPYFEVSSEKIELMNEVLAAGNIISSSHDLTKWLQALMAGKVLTSESLHKLFTASPVHPYGLGWQIETTDYATPVYWHGGNWVGYRSLIAVAPEFRTSVVWLSNGPLKDERNSRLEEQLLDAVFSHDQLSSR